MFPARLRVKLYKGQAVTVGVESPNSLYQYSLATYDEGDIYDQTSAVGFIDIFGLPVRVQAGEAVVAATGRRAGTYHRDVVRKLEVSRAPGVDQRGPSEDPARTWHDDD